jgi:7-cyano-7-deazaguanine tRNA-ribosyltransferase
VDFYVSWYLGDPFYPVHDDDCALLVSITSVARDWTIGRFPQPPKRLMIDSGGYRFAVAPQEALSPAQVLQRQLDLVDGATIPTIVCARDYPILDKSLSSSEKDQCITQTIAYAYEMKKLVERDGLPENVTPLAVIQGYDVDSLLYCAKELMAIDFPLYGIGSLAGLRQHQLIMERVMAVGKLVGTEKLHIFGVSVIQTVRAFRKMGIHSIDSARPAKSAAFNEIIYSNPYRRFGILEPHSAKKKRFSRQRRLDRPLPCDCPICEEDASRILVSGKRENIRNRALHNYYHLKRAFTN